MPNWCYNGITLRHADPQMIDRAQHSKGLLMEFLPTPQPLLDTMAGSFGDDDRQRELEEQQVKNLDTYGAKDWYEWNIRNWGTKWDFELDNVHRVDEYTLTAAFDSAWSPPIEAYNELLALGFEITALYYEPGMAYVGKYENGFDEYYEIGGYNSGTVREAIGEELDDYFGISEEMAQYDEEDDVAE